MADFYWMINSLDAYPKVSEDTNVVFSVNWQCVAQESGVQSTYAGSTKVSFNPGDPFTPYNELTEQQVWGWINPSIDRQKIEVDLQSSIDAQLNPPVVTPPLPWAN